MAGNICCSLLSCFYRFCRGKFGRAAFLLYVVFSGYFIAQLLSPDVFLVIPSLDSSAPETVAASITQTNRSASAPKPSQSLHPAHTSTNQVASTKNRATASRTASKHADRRHGKADGTFAHHPAFSHHESHMQPMIAHNGIGLPDDGIIAIEASDASYMGFNVVQNREAFEGFAPSCVAHCSQRRHVWFQLASSMGDTNQQRQWSCEWRRRLVISRKKNRFYAISSWTNATYHPPHYVQCPVPYTAHDNCKGHNWNLWDIQLQRADGIVLQQKQVVDIQSSRDRLFQIASIYTASKGNTIQRKLRTNMNKNAFVVSFFLFDSRLMDSCNAVHCLYQVHSATQSDPNAQESPVESSVALPGRFVDVSLVVCPIPPQILSLTQSNGDMDSDGYEIQANTKYISLRLAYSANFLSFPAPFTPQSPRPSTAYPHVNMAICSIVRKEGYNIREWIEFHRMMGYGRFILYDNNPIDEPDVVMQQVLRKYHPHLVVVIPWKIQHSQTEALTDCIMRFGSTTEWFTFIDVDEFIVPAAPYPTIRYVLTQTRLSKSSYIHSKWITFGPCIDPRDETELRPFNLTESESDDSTMAGSSSATPYSHPSPTPNKKLEQMLSPNRTLAMEICHSKTEVGSELPKATFRARDAASIHGYGPHHIRLMQDVGRSDKSESVPGDRYMRVYHYRYKTWDDFLSRRLGPIAGLTTQWTELSLRGSWNRGLRNREPFPKEENTILRFIPKLRQRLGLPESPFDFI